MKFIVTASKFQLNDPPRNPFRMKITQFGAGTTIRNTYDIEAQSEQEVRRLWEEGQKHREWPNIVGFTIEKIEPA